MSIRSGRFSIIPLAAIFALFIASKPAEAELCTIDAVPAATLLVPYFEVDLNACETLQGSNTYVRIINTEPAPAIAHVTMWTDLSLPSIAFDIFLTGFDVEVIDLRDIFCNGVVPGLGPIAPPEAQGDPTNTLSPFGINRVRAAHQGTPDPNTNLCLGTQRNSNLAIGYMTIDNVNEFGLVFPSDGQDYFDFASFSNALSGHIYYETFETIQEASVQTFESEQPSFQPENCRRLRGRKKKRNCRLRNNTVLNVLNQLPPYPPITEVTFNDVQKSLGLHGIPIVHIEADSSFNSSSTSSGQTFYGRYVTGGTDGREPLDTKFASSYTQANSTYDLIVWRDSASADVTPLNCGANPSWFPLNGTVVTAFDENEEGVEIPKTFPLETQLLPNFANGTPFESGWFHIDFKNGTDSTQAYVYQRRDGVVDGAGVTALQSGCN